MTKARHTLLNLHYLAIIFSLIFAFTRQVVAEKIITPNQSLPLNIYGEHAWKLYLVDLPEIAPSIQLDIRYFTDYNFIGKRIPGYNAPKCLLTRQAAEALKQAQQELITQGFSLKVYDCYRPQQAVNEFVRWAIDQNDTRMQAIFYPNVDKKELFAKGYLAGKSGHSRGSTVDLTLVPLNGKPQEPCRLGKLCQDNSIDMGTSFDFFDPKSNTLNPVISGVPLQNRLRLKSVMEKAGFKNLPEEWWHFTLINEPFADTYLNFSIE